MSLQELSATLIKGGLWRNFTAGSVGPPSCNETKQQTISYGGAELCTPVRTGAKTKPSRNRER
jgi:hypothetical protein